MSFGDRLYREGVIPPQLIEDANIIEDIFPKFVDDEIDKVQDLIDYREHIFSEPNPSPTKRQKTSSNMVSYQRRKRSPITAASVVTMKKKLRKIDCCVDTEKGVAYVNVNLTIAAAGMSTINLFGAISKGDESSGRTGDVIKVKSIETLVTRPLLTGGNVAQLDMYYLKPLDVDSPPISGHFSNAGLYPGGFYMSLYGQTVKHFKYLLGNVPFWNFNKYYSRPLTVRYAGNDARQNNLYFVVRNNTGETVTMTGTIKIEFYG